MSSWPRSHSGSGGIEFTASLRSSAVSRGTA
jgi:hypothetical protein